MTDIIIVIFNFLVFAYGGSCRTELCTAQLCFVYLLLSFLWLSYFLSILLFVTSIVLCWSSSASECSIVLSSWRYGGEYSPWPLTPDTPGLSLKHGFFHRYDTYVVLHTLILSVLISEYVTIKLFIFLRILYILKIDKGAVKAYVYRTCSGLCLYWLYVRNGVVGLWLINSCPHCQYNLNLRSVSLYCSISLACRSCLLVLNTINVNR